MSNSKDKNKENEKTTPALKPDPETLHKTDPQESMEGPVSSMMQNIKEEAEKDDKDKKENDED